MHPVPRRHGQGSPVDGAEAVGRPTAAGAIAGDDGRVDLRTGPGRAKSGAHRLEILSRRGRAMTMPVSFTLNGTPVVCPSNQTILLAAQQHGVEIPHLCYMEGLRPDGNCRTCMVEI